MEKILNQITEQYVQLFAIPYLVCEQEKKLNADMHCLLTDMAQLIADYIDLSLVVSDR